MTKLLVSVRNRLEASAALEAGVGLLDVKEPDRGSLGAADGGTISEIVSLAGGRTPVSAALGELRETPVDNDGAAYRGLAYVKLGLSGCAAAPDWRDRWKSRLQSVPADASRVAVVYADWLEAEAPPPEDVLAAGRLLDCRAALLDTFDKSAGTLLERWTLEEVAAFTAAARSAGMRSAVAGSLDEESIDAILPLAPDYLAIRGAVCSPSRTGNLDPEKLDRIVRRVRE